MFSRSTTLPVMAVGYVEAGSRLFGVAEESSGAINHMSAEFVMMLFGKTYARPRG